MKDIFIDFLCEKYCFLRKFLECKKCFSFKQKIIEKSCVLHFTPSSVSGVTDAYAASGSKFQCTDNHIK